MRGRRPTGLEGKSRHLAAASAVLLGGCSLLAPFRLGDLHGRDADVHADADADVRSDAPADGEPEDAGADVVTVADGDEDGGEGGALTGPGPMTFVLDRVEHSMERRCDVDGDGSPDNALASLGEGPGSSLAGFLNLILAGQVDEGFRYVVHVPWVEDRDRPRDEEVVAILFRGRAAVVDGGPPDDPGDDFSGRESFWAWAPFVDGCGEPLFALRNASIEEGALAASDGTVFGWLGEVVPVERARAGGTVEPGAAGIELWTCGVATIHGLGPLPQPMATGLTMLEVFAAGGAAFGMPAIPGLPVDADLDGDGLERLVLDSEGRLVGCVDGDLTAIDGGDCWDDPRIADGFSLTVEGTGVPALFAGLEPGWQDRHPEGCPDPPEASLFDPR